MHDRTTSALVGFIGGGCLAGACFGAPSTLSLVVTLAAGAAGAWLGWRAKL